MNNKDFKDLDIGQKFIYKEKVVLEVCKSRYCDECYFVDNTCSQCWYEAKQGYIPYCTPDNRKDGNNVIFKEV